ncbi:RNA binding protein [Novymonas esmeraldas]|uniref:RNA binding protein n=1 Tax=Novymonas esmeraldas TaxID=1808958 RepID=A0AAW0F484_9TRYP
MHPTRAPVPVPLGAERPSPPLSHRLPGASPGTSPTSAAVSTLQRMSSGAPTSSSRQSPTSSRAPVVVGSVGGAHAHYHSHTGGVHPLSIEVPRPASSSLSSSSPAGAPRHAVQQQHQQQHVRAEVNRGRSPAHHGGGPVSTVPVISHPLPTLSAERLSEVAGPACGPSRVTGMMQCSTPVGGVLDGPPTPLVSVPATPVTPVEHSSTNLILYNIGPHMTEAALRGLFDPFGEVVSCAVMRDIHTGAGLGTAFVRYAHHNDACRALEAFSDRANPVCVHESKPLAVQWARRQHDGAPAGEARKKIMKLFVRNIPLDCTIEDLEALFGQYGPVRQVTLHKDTSPVEDEAMVRLIAFVIYAEEGAAELASSEVHNTRPFESCNGIPIMIKLAESSQRRRFMKNADGATPNTYSMPRTSPMTPGASGSHFDMTAAMPQPHLYAHMLHQRHPLAQRGYDSTTSYPGTSAFDAAVVACAPHPDMRDLSVSSHHGTPQPLPVSVSGGGTPAAMTPLSFTIGGGGSSPAQPLHAQPTAPYMGDRDDCSSSPYSASSPPVSAAGQVYRQPPSLSFDATAAPGACGALSTSSKSNCQSVPDAGVISAGGRCPSGSFLYSNSGSQGDTSPSFAGGTPHAVPTSAQWCGSQSGSFTVAAPQTRPNMDASRSPPVAVAASAPPYPSARASSGASVASGSVHGSPLWPGGNPRTPLTSARLTAGGCGSSASDMGSTIASNNSVNGAAFVNAAAHSAEPPTQRMDASESWRRAVRTHVHNTKLQTERSSASGSLTSMGAGCSAGPQPATTSPTSSARRASILSQSCNETPANGVTPPTSPMSTSALSGDQAGTRATGTGTPSSGRTRYYNNPYSSESAKLFC